MKKLQLISSSFALSFFLLFACPVNAGTRIAILNFELMDYTSMPNTPKELIRTASIKPLLEDAMKKTGDYEIIQIDDKEQNAANAGFGYLFRFNDVAATLGKQYGVDWIIVGQHSKGSFLYSYLIANLINVENGNLVGRYEVEMKGTHEKVKQRGVKALATKIHQSMRQPIYRKQW